LLALRDTPLESPARHTLARCEGFARPMLTAQAVEGEHARFDISASSSLSVVARPLLDHEDSPPPLRALSFAAAAAGRLVDALIQGSAFDPRLEGWAEQVAPLDAATIPPGLLGSLPDFSDARLDEAALSPSLVPLTTSWLPLQPTQPEAPGAPLCPRFRDIPTASGLARWDEWMAHTLTDLQSIERQLASGVPPSEVSRDRPAAIAIGQDETNSWARGRV